MLNLTRVYQPKHWQTVGWQTVWHLLMLAALAYLITYLPIEIAIIALVGLGGGLFLLCRSWLIWPLIGVALPFTSAIAFGPTKGTDILLLVAVALWFVDGVRRRTLRLQISWPLLLFALFFLFQAGLLLTAVDLGEAVTEVIKWGQIGLILALIPVMVPDEKRIWVVAAILVGGALQALLGLYQFIFQIGHPSFILMGRFMRASGTFAQPNPFAGYLGTLLPVAAALWAGALVALFNQKRTHRLLPNQLAHQGINGPFVAFLFYGGMTGLIGLGIIVSWSRGGWLGTAAALGLVLGLQLTLAPGISHRKSSRESSRDGSRAGHRRWLIGGAGMLVLGLGLLVATLQPVSLPPSIQARLGNLSGYLGVNMDRVLDQPVNDDNFAIIERLAHWKAATLMWDDNPWLGVGPGGYAAAYPKAIQADPRLLRWDDPLGHAHNIYLNLLAETGIIGLALYIGLMAGLVGWLWRRGRRVSSGRVSSGRVSLGRPQGYVPTCAPMSVERASLAIGVLGVLVYLAVHNGFDNIYVQGIYLHLGFWLALLVEGDVKPMRT